MQRSCLCSQLQLSPLWSTAMLFLIAPSKRTVLEEWYQNETLDHWGKMEKSRIGKQKWVSRWGWTKMCLAVAKNGMGLDGWEFRERNVYEGCEWKWGVRAWEMRMGLHGNGNGLAWTGMGLHGWEFRERNGYEGCEWKWVEVRGTCMGMRMGLHGNGNGLAWTGMGLHGMGWKWAEEGDCDLVNRFCVWLLLKKCYFIVCN